VVIDIGFMLRGSKKELKERGKNVEKMEEKGVELRFFSTIDLA
jgi:IS4 transposase